MTGTPFTAKPAENFSISLMRARTSAAGPSLAGMARNQRNLFNLARCRARLDRPVLNLKTIDDL